MNAIGEVHFPLSKEKALMLLKPQCPKHTDFVFTGILGCSEIQWKWKTLNIQHLSGLFLLLFEHDEHDL